MKKTDRYIVRIYSENKLAKICVKETSSQIADFFAQIFDGYPEANRVSVRKLYNPLESNSEIDDQRTFIARSRDSQLHGSNCIIQEEKKTVLLFRDEYTKEVPIQLLLF
jgi:hypothetical protein